MSDLILHHYWQSPFAHKIRLALALAGCEWYSVVIPRIPPKPFLLPLTAGYRRTPVLQIGCDIHCDTRQIISTLADRGLRINFFPEKIEGKALSYTSWIDSVIFELAVRVVITCSLESAPLEFINDRGGLYFGLHWTPKKLKRELPSIIAQMAAEFDSIEKSIPDIGGIFSKKYSFADISIAYIAWFIRGRWNEGATFLSQFPKIERIEKEVNEICEDQYTKMEGPVALQEAKWAISLSPRGVFSKVRSDLLEGEMVEIRPQKQSIDPPTIGRLRYLDNLQVSIDHYTEICGEVVVHLPLAGYQVNAISSDKSR